MSADRGTRDLLAAISELLDVPQAAVSEGERGDRRAASTARDRICTVRGIIDAVIVHGVSTETAARLARGHIGEPLGYEPFVFGDREAG